MISQVKKRYSDNWTRIRCNTHICAGGWAVLGICILHHAWYVPIALAVGVEAMQFLEPERKFDWLDSIFDSLEWMLGGFVSYGALFLIELIPTQ